MLKGDFTLPAIIFGFLLFAYKAGVLKDLAGVFKMEGLAPSGEK